MNENNRATYVHGRVSEAERELWERLADVERVNLSEAIRIALREAGKSRGLWPLPEGTPEPESEAA